jgi:hypothetical protein
MLFTIFFKLLQLTKTITWDDDECVCNPDDDGENKIAGVSDAEFVSVPKDVVQEGKAAEIRNRALSPKLKRMPTIFIIADERVEDVQKHYEKHRSYEKTKV